MKSLLERLHEAKTISELGFTVSETNWPKEAGDAYREAPWYGQAAVDTLGTVGIVAATGGLGAIPMVASKLPKVAQAATYISNLISKPKTISQAIGGGLIDSGTQAVVKAGTGAIQPEEILRETTFGGLGAGTGHGAMKGLENFTTKTPEAALLDIDLTTGENYGGLFKVAEDIGARVPFVKGQIAKAQNRSLANWHRSRVDAILGEVGLSTSGIKADGSMEGLAIDKINREMPHADITGMMSGANRQKANALNQAKKNIDELYQGMDKYDFTPSNFLDANASDFTRHSSTELDDLDYWLKNHLDQSPHPADVHTRSADSLNNARAAENVLSHKFKQPQIEEGIGSLGTVASMFLNPGPTATAIGAGAGAYTKTGQNIMNSSIEAINSGANAFGPRATNAGSIGARQAGRDDPGEAALENEIGNMSQEEIAAELKQLEAEGY